VPDARLAAPPISKKGRMEGDLSLYRFSRSKVECGDFDLFLSLYEPDKPPTGRRDKTSRR
jgi:hypothetical protein